MRMLRCDVCETDHEWADEEQFFVLEVPAQELSDGIQGTYSLDICSPECLLTAAKAFNGQPEEEQPKPESIPERNGKLSPMENTSTRRIVGTGFEANTTAGPHYEGEVQVR